MTEKQNLLQDSRKKIPDKQKKSIDPLPDEGMLEELLCAEFSKDAEGKGPAAGCIRTYAGEITPFQDLIRMCTAGLIMGSITLNFAGLGWALPLLGSILTYIGMRGLRRANSWFGAAWVLSLARLLYHSALIFACASPLYLKISGWNNWIGAGLELVMLYCMGRGMQRVNRETAGNAGKTGNPALPIMLWKLTVIALALLSSRISGGLTAVIAIGMLAVFIFTVKSILKLADAIHDGGYEMQAAPVRVSEKTLWIGLAVFFIAGLFLCKITFHYTPMDWKESILQGGDTDLLTLRAELEEKGFSRERLDQIADEDLADLQEQEIVNVRVVDYDEAQNGEASEKMTGSMAYVQTRDGEVKVFFLYAYRQEKGILQPHSRIADGARLLATDPWSDRSGGRIFCEKGGKTLEAVLTAETETIVTPWIGSSVMTRSYLKARYSYPLLSKAQRGYLFAWMSKDVFGCNADIYACTPGIQLPYKELPEIDRSGGLTFGSAPKERILSLYTSYDQTLAGTETAENAD